MKKLHLLIIKNFIGPFVLTFFIVMFVLLMQFLWRYIDELVGKGLELKIIAELLVYTSASLVALALPLSILMSSLMAFGSMGEFYELTAMKSSGISLQRIMLPLMIFVVLISIGAFFFSTNVLPVTNLKMRALLWDVRQQRPELQIREGEFYNGVEGYSIRINKKNPQTNILYDLKIYDHSEKKGNISVIVADSGYMKMTADESNLIINLWNGYSYNEQEEDRRKFPKTYPHRMDKFKEQRIVIELTGFGLQRSDENLFKNDYQMMSLKQLSKVEDSLRSDLQTRENQFIKTLMIYNLFKVRNTGKPHLAHSGESADQIMKNPKVVNIDSLYDSFSLKDKQSIIHNILSLTRSTKSYVESSCENLKYKRKQLRRHEIEWHRKFTLSIACLIFLFIGAPLGAIIRKGGLGMPTVVSVLLFIFYYIITLIGEKVVRESIVTSFQGMWMSSLILLVIGIFLTYKAATDSVIFNIDIYLKFLAKLFGIEKTTMLDKKVHLAGKFDYSEIEKESLIGSFGKLINFCNKSRIEILQNIKLKNLLKRYPSLDIPTGDSFRKLGILYNEIFENTINSKWVRISYIKSKFAELPYIHFKAQENLIPKKTERLMAIIFPIGVVVIIVNVFRKLRITRKLISIEKLSQSIIKGLNNPTLLSELEYQL
ncbi:MAG: LptF/LptG family permease [Bacteroidales bacterium]|nr:LptF/LptG family permease [Bacteroidales bacterium]